MEDDLDSGHGDVSVGEPPRRFVDSEGRGPVVEVGRDPAALLDRLAGGSLELPIAGVEIDAEPDLEGVGQIAHGADPGGHG